MITAIQPCHKPHQLIMIYHQSLVAKDLLSHTQCPPERTHYTKYSFSPQNNPGLEWSHWRCGCCTHNGVFLIRSPRIITLRVGPAKLVSSVDTSQGLPSVTATVVRLVKRGEMLVGHSKLNVCLCFLISAQPLTVTIFNMTKEVTLWKEKKKDSTDKMLSPWRQWRCSLGVHQEWWFLQRCGSPGEESRSCERGHSFHSPQSTQFCQPRCHQLPPPLQTASAWSPQFWKRKSAYNTGHQANISDNDKSPYKGWLQKV